jgi:hypothetical protein
MPVSADIHVAPRALDDAREQLAETIRRLDGAAGMVADERRDSLHNRGCGPPMASPRPSSGVRVEVPVQSPMPSLLATAPAWLRVVVGVISALSLAFAVAVVVLTARRPRGPRLGLARICSASLSGVLVGLTFAGVLPRWGMACASLAFLIAVLAVALQFGQLEPLRAYLERPSSADEPGWWPEFEQGFRRYSTRRRRWRHRRRGAGGDGGAPERPDDREEEVPW